MHDLVLTIGLILVVGFLEHVGGEVFNDFLGDKVEKVVGEEPLEDDGEACFLVAEVGIDLRRVVEGAIDEQGDVLLGHVGQFALGVLLDERVDYLLDLLVGQLDDGIAVVGRFSLLENHIVEFNRNRFHEFMSFSAPKGGVIFKHYVNLVAQARAKDFIIIRLLCSR